ncbi:hypothetical protein MXAN_6353 [Myxococcus xanthus DK 1622]|uniref:Uncharacterized protein n=1 Tax=Myxococcus xanthus (strain DK1622) TaxID=246197 RepID=Q1CYP6_MYXXD|nr:hypothetical protein MXAN_6353 [Myxococcus xanthus DK 1622]
MGTAGRVTLHGVAAPLSHLATRSRLKALPVAR